MKTILLDTHALLWFLWDDVKLSDRAKSLIEDAENLKLVSITSCWEIAVKVGLGKLDLGEPSGTFLPRELARNNFEMLPITLKHVARIETLPQHHHDPFDRLLAAQAMVENISLASRDEVFDLYDVIRVW
jgi:PIN domain nuclease of toxin-antitoxin system